MPKALEEIAKDAMDLPARQRLALAEFLFESAEMSADPEAETAWDTEIRDRIRAIDDGRVTGVAYEDVMREAEAIGSVTIRFVDEAQREFLEAILDYEEIRAGLGRRFKDEVDRRVLWIADHPQLYRLRPGEYRRINLRVFPYYIPYIVRGDLLWVLAVAHGSRKPLYWISRRNEVP